MDYDREGHDVSEANLISPRDYAKPSHAAALVLSDFTHLAQGET